MGKYAVFVIGPAGAGKSTLTTAFQAYCDEIGRSVHAVNLDPAAEVFKYKPSIDIRDLITVDDTMEELGLGPNGGLIYAMEYLVDNLDWLEEQLENFSDDYLVFDCPGQIELYFHHPAMSRLTSAVVALGYRATALYALDAHFTVDPAKFVSGTLSALAAMTALELPHLNVLTKMDLLPSAPSSSEPPAGPATGVQLPAGVGPDGLGLPLETYLQSDLPLLLTSLNAATPAKFERLNKVLAETVEDYGLIQYIPLDLTKPNAFGELILHLDNTNQYGEDEEVRLPAEAEDPDDELGDPSTVDLSAYI